MDGFNCRHAIMFDVICIMPYAECQEYLHAGREPAGMGPATKWQALRADSYPRPGQLFPGRVWSGAPMK